MSYLHADGDGISPSLGLLHNLLGMDGIWSGADYTDHISQGKTEDQRHDGTDEVGNPMTPDEREHVTSSKRCSSLYANSIFMTGNHEFRAQLNQHAKVGTREPTYSLRTKEWSHVQHELRAVYHAVVPLLP